MWWMNYSSVPGLNEIGELGWPSRWNVDNSVSAAKPFKNLTIRKQFRVLRSVVFPCNFAPRCIYDATGIPRIAEISREGCCFVTTRSSDAAVVKCSKSCLEIVILQSDLTLKDGHGDRLVVRR